MLMRTRKPHNPTIKCKSRRASMPTPEPEVSVVETTSDTESPAEDVAPADSADAAVEEPSP